MTSPPEFEDVGIVTNFMYKSKEAALRMEFGGGAEAKVVRLNAKPSKDRRRGRGPLADAHPQLLSAYDECAAEKMKQEKDRVTMINVCIH